MVTHSTEGINNDKKQTKVLNMTYGIIFQLKKLFSAIQCLCFENILMNMFEFKLPVKNHIALMLEQKINAINNLSARKITNHFGLGHYW